MRLHSGNEGLYFAGHKERLTTYTCGSRHPEVKQHAECVGDCCYTKCRKGYVAVGTYPLCHCVQNKWGKSGASLHQGMIVQDTIVTVFRVFSKRSLFGILSANVFRFSPKEPDACRSALDSVQYRSQGHRPSSFLS